MKRKRIFLTLLALLLSTAALLSGVACTAPEVPPEGPLKDAWKHQVANTEILETENFLDAPDSVVYYDKSFENVVALSAEDAAALHTAFVDLQRGLYHQISLKGYYNYASIKEYVEQFGAIELRYDQRRQYVGPALEAEKVGGAVMRWDFSRLGAFDALLIIPTGGHHLLVVPYLDGTYKETIDYQKEYSAFVYGQFEAVWENVVGNTDASALPVPQSKILDGVEYTLTVNNESIGIRIYVRMIDGITTNDGFMEYYDQEGVLQDQTRSDYVLTPEDEAAARALLARFEAQMLRDERQYHFSDHEGEIALFESYTATAEDDRLYAVTERFDPETGGRVLVSKEPCC